MKIVAKILLMLALLAAVSATLAFWRAEATPLLADKLVYGQANALVQDGRLDVQRLQSALEDRGLGRLASGAPDDLSHWLPTDVVESTVAHERFWAWLWSFHAAVVGSCGFGVLVLSGRIARSEATVA